MEKSSLQSSSSNKYVRLFGFVLGGRFNSVSQQYEAFIEAADRIHEVYIISSPDSNIDEILGHGAVFVALDVIDIVVKNRQIAWIGKSLQKRGDVRWR